FAIQHKAHLLSVVEYQFPSTVGTRLSSVDEFFFFQAEDGIRDFHVTGVQTCALPIYFASIWDAKSRTLPKEWLQNTQLGRVGGGFVDQQDRNIVLDRINPPALSAFQALAFLEQRLFADWADQDFQ